MAKARITTLSIALIGFSACLSAHPGGLNKEGCHNDHKHGGYHCHLNESAPATRGSSAAMQEKAVEEAVREKRPFNTVYDRDDWPHWIDSDGDCQDTRAEILIAGSKVPVKFKRNKGCNVTWGEWFDPYTGKTFTKASDLDIDHIVPLKWAHTHGGANWTRSQKRDYANDRENLLAVHDVENQAKSDKGPNIWMPPRHEYRCEYLTRFDYVVTKYGLQYTATESRVITKMRKACQ